MLSKVQQSKFSKLDVKSPILVHLEPPEDSSHLVPVVYPR